MGLEVVDQGDAIGLAAFRIAQGVELQGGVLQQAQFVQHPRAGSDDLHVARRLRHAHQFDADLVELPLAPLLRPLVTEHRPRVEELEGQLLRQAVGEKGAGHAGGVLRPQGDALAIAEGEAVHLLGHDVGGFADRPFEDFGELHDRRRHEEIAIAFGDVARDFDDVAVAPHGGGQQVVGTANGLQAGHGRRRPCLSDVLLDGGVGLAASRRREKPEPSSRPTLDHASPANSIACLI